MPTASPSEPTTAASGVPAPVGRPQRVRVDGKFFRLGEAKFYLKGLTYGPFAPDPARGPFPEPAEVERDFGQILEVGANLLRLYHVPPRWLLDLADGHGLKLFVDVPWHNHHCFLDSAATRAEIRQRIREAACACRGHPALFALSVANEIPGEIVRWSGVQAVSDFLDTLVAEVKGVEAETLCTCASFPPAEFLAPRRVDFLCYNVYLHHRAALENYLARLQTLADQRPLVLGEFGIDALREGEERQSEILAWQIETAFRTGLAGAILFSYTDDWHRGGRRIEDWAFGLTTRERRPKPALAAVRQCYHAAPHFPLARVPKVSVVVACYNGGRTLGACLESLTRLDYPDYEVILVDDGSTDATAQIARLYPAVRYLHQPNCGLSVARNTGIAAAAGEIVAFTDADCRVDEDWLYYLVHDLLQGGFIGIGGPNFLPPEDSPVAGAVLVSPGGPAHVMLTDREAEHLPGCNLAVFKWALEDIGGFDPVFMKAGDDVDVCWRLLERGYKLGFSPAGFVWHYRRSTARAYLRQQRGYGEAEALLARKHPGYFNLLGGGIWRGRIYAAARSGLVLRRPVVYHGLFGSGFFQKLYQPEPVFGLMLATSLEAHLLVTLPLLVLSALFPFLLPVALASFGLSLAVCVAAALQAELPREQRRFWSRPLVALLFFLQPIVRGMARYRGRLTARSKPRAVPSLAVLPRSALAPDPPSELVYGKEGGVDRYRFLAAVTARLAEQGWQHRLDTGWTDHDLEISGNRWSRLRLISVAEVLGGGRGVLRCRLRAAWSLRAWAIFGLLVGLELLGIGLFAAVQPWIWMMLLSLPLLGWVLEQEKRNVQHLILALLDEVAGRFGLTRVSSDPAGGGFGGEFSGRDRPVGADESTVPGAEGSRRA